MDSDSDIKEKNRLVHIRKRQEFKLIKRFDKSTIQIGKECWFIIDANWLNKWSNFVNNIDEDEEPDNKGQALQGLKITIDYRGVCPMVYFIFLELYGKDNSPELTRFMIDIYKSSVPIEKLITIQMTCRTQASIHVNKVRPKWIKWERYEEDEIENDIFCCGLTKEHLEAFIYWAITCWSSSSKPVKYTNYKPLRNKDTEEELDTVRNESISNTSSHKMGYDTTVAFDNSEDTSKIPEISSEKRKVNKIRSKKKNNRSNSSNQIQEQLTINTIERIRSTNTIVTSKSNNSISSDDESDSETTLVNSIGLAERDHFKGAWWFGLRNN